MALAVVESAEQVESVVTAVVELAEQVVEEAAEVVVVELAE